MQGGNIMDGRYSSITLRKLFVFIILFCLAMGHCSSSLADFDIIFRDITWLSSEKQVLQALKKQGVVTADMDLTDLRRDLIQEWGPFAGCEYLNGVETKYSSELVYDRVPQTDYFFRGSYNYSEHRRNPICQVAGYDVSTIRVYFLPKVKAQPSGAKTYNTSDLLFVRAGYNIEDLYYGEDEKVYLDLQSKLTSLYGKPIENNAVLHGMYWHSSDGSGVQLTRFDDMVTIVYAYINDEDMVAELNAIQHAIEAAEGAKNSTDGL